MLASLDRPVLVTGALPDLDAEAWLGQLLSCLQGRETEFQVSAVARVWTGGRLGEGGKGG